LAQWKSALLFFVLIGWKTGSQTKAVCKVSWEAATWRFIAVYISRYDFEDPGHHVTKLKVIFYIFRWERPEDTNFHALYCWQILGSAFSATALFLLGLRMVGKVHTLKGATLVVPGILIAVKL
jgi:hypothetical protein